MNKKRRKAKFAKHGRRQQKKAEDHAQLIELFQESRKWYVEKWSEDAAHFEAHAQYDWMAGFLSGYHLILEIGTGEGSGTLALCKRGAIVVSVEENPLCIQRAQQKLRDGGVPVSTELRSRVISVPVTYGPLLSTIPTQGALLLEGDIGNPNDSELHRWLASTGKFDAISCWNIGTHLMRHAAVGGIDLYRLRIQNFVYEIADHILRPGGVLHFVDRGGVASRDDYKTAAGEVVAAHREQANVTSIIVDPESVSIRPYDLPPPGIGIPMLTGGSAGTPVDGKEMALWSILARKP